MLANDVAPDDIVRTLGPRALQFMPGEKMPVPGESYEWIPVDYPIPKPAFDEMGPTVEQILLDIEEYQGDETHDPRFHVSVEKRRPKRVRQGLHHAMSMALATPPVNSLLRYQTTRPPGAVFRIPINPSALDAMPPEQLGIGILRLYLRHVLEEKHSPRGIRRVKQQYEHDVVSARNLSAIVLPGPKSRHSVPADYIEAVPVFADPHMPRSIKRSLNGHRGYGFGFAGLASARCSVFNSTLGHVLEISTAAIAPSELTVLLKPERSPRRRQMQGLDDYLK